MERGRNLEPEGIAQEITFSDRLRGKEDRASLVSQSFLKTNAELVFSSLLHTSLTFVWRIAGMKTLVVLGLCFASFGLINAQEISITTPELLH